MIVMSANMVDLEAATHFRMLNMHLVQDHPAFEKFVDLTVAT